MAKRMLILYYSWANGNTKAVAERLQKATGADMARIDTIRPYEGSYDDVVAQGKRETERGFRPAVQPLAHDPADYDVIAVGTPTWWYTMAPAVLTVLTGRDWTGRTVVPFQTHAGWPGHVLADMEKAASGASAACPMQVRFDSEGGAHQVTSAADVDAWCASVKALLKD